MEATGERLILNAGFTTEAEAEHLERYRYACRFAAGATVVDVACGSGYGSKMLADAGAVSVLGMDVSAEAVAHAAAQYPAPNLTFQVGDAQDLKAVPSDSVDLVVSFETIEHLPDVDRYLDEMRRILKPGGQYVVSTPDVRLSTVLYPLVSRPSNPYHVREYAARDFRAMLEKRFEIVEFAGQNYVKNFWVFWPWQVLVRGVCRLLRPIEKRRLISKVYFVGTGFAVEAQSRHPRSVARFWVVRCRKPGGA
ncbi:MAG: class I SAM-dependent methyltransferase [Phycisphaerae bacterium]|nr:class I SAM-dependent methyltransferase [Tepidisphaeraceae bacterium]